MAFHVVSSFLLRVLASKTIKQKHLIGCWKIQAIQKVVFEANTRNKKEDTTWKAMKNWTRKCYIFLCTITFEVIWPSWKMWRVKCFTKDDFTSVRACFLNKAKSQVCMQKLNIYSLLNFIVGTFIKREWKKYTKVDKNSGFSTAKIILMWRLLAWLDYILKIL